METSPDSAPIVSRRRLLLPALLLAHAGLLLLVGRARLTVSEPPPQLITVAEIAAAPPPSLPVEVKLFPISATVDAPDLATAAEAEDQTATAELAQAGTGCDLSGAVQQRLRSDSSASAALGRIPRASRSVADAIILWDGRWIDGAAVGGSAALDPVRAAVAAAVRSAPASCRNATVVGPRLIIIAGSAGNQILAFGSGQWTWAQVAS